MPAAQHGAQASRVEPKRRVVAEPKPAPEPPVSIAIPLTFEGLKPLITIPAGLNTEAQEQIRLGALRERIAEVVRAIAFESGDPKMIEWAEAALEERGLVGKPRKRGKGPRRTTVYLKEEVGAPVWAMAKESQLSPTRYIERVLKDHVAQRLASK